MFLRSALPRSAHSSARFIMRVSGYGTIDFVKRVQVRLPGGERERERERERQVTCDRLLREAITVRRVLPKGLIQFSNYLFVFLCFLL